MITQKSCLTLFLLSVLKKTVVKHIKSSKIDVDIVSITDILLMLLLLIIIMMIIVLLVLLLLLLLLLQLIKKIIRQSNNK